MTDKDLIRRVEDFQDTMVTIKQSIIQDNSSLTACQECGDNYHTDIIALTGNDCPCCYEEKEFGILPDYPACFGSSVPNDQLSNPNYFPTDHPDFDRAIKAQEKVGGVFNLGRKL